MSVDAMMSTMNQGMANAQLMAADTDPATAMRGYDLGAASEVGPVQGIAFDGVSQLLGAAAVVLEAYVGEGGVETGSGQYSAQECLPLTCSASRPPSPRFNPASDPQLRNPLEALKDVARLLGM